MVVKSAKKPHNTSANKTSPERDTVGKEGRKKRLRAQRLLGKLLTKDLPERFIMLGFWYFGGSHRYIICLIDGRYHPAEGFFFVAWRRFVKLCRPILKYFAIFFNIICWKNLPCSMISSPLPRPPSSYLPSHAIITLSPR